MTFVLLEEVGEKEPLEGYVGRFIHSEDMTVAYWTVVAGAPFPEHSHPHEQIAIVSEGEFELTVEGETQILDPGRVAVIPSGAPHSGRALTPCKLIDVFHPVREEYR